MCDLLHHTLTLAHSEVVNTSDFDSDSVGSNPTVPARAFGVMLQVLPEPTAVMSSERGLNFGIMLIIWVTVIVNMERRLYTQEYLHRIKKTTCKIKLNT